MQVEAEKGRFRSDRVAWRDREVAQQVREERGAKKRREFSLPESVLDSLDEIAIREQKSVTTLLMEIMQRGDKRLGITEVHFVDLRRKLPLHPS